MTPGQAARDLGKHPAQSYAPNPRLFPQVAPQSLHTGR